MKIKKDQLVKVNHVRKGRFNAIADNDFDTDTTTWYPLSVAQEDPINGFSTVAKWRKGESIPCRNSLCEISIIEKGK